MLRIFSEFLLEMLRIYLKLLRISLEDVEEGFLFHGVLEDFSWSS